MNGFAIITFIGFETIEICVKTWTNFGFVVTFSVHTCTCITTRIGNIFYILYSLISLDLNRQTQKNIIKKLGHCGCICGTLLVAL